MGTVAEQPNGFSSKVHCPHRGPPNCLCVPALIRRGAGTRKSRLIDVLAHKYPLVAETISHAETNCMFHVKPSATLREHSKPAFTQSVWIRMKTEGCIGSRGGQLPQASRPAGSFTSPSLVPSSATRHSYRHAAVQFRGSGFMFHVKPNSRPRRVNPSR
jgi:hypothetical protein